MKPKYWAITILSAGVVAVSLLYFIKQPALDVGPTVVHREVKSKPLATTASSLDVAVKTTKAYFNDKLELGFSYPANWTVDFGAQDQIISVNEPGDDLGDGSITVSKNKETKEAFISEIKQDTEMQIIGQAEEQFNVLNWTKITTKEKKSGKTEVNYFYEKNNVTISVSYFNYQIQEGVAKEILDSFKFTK